MEYPLNHNHVKNEVNLHNQRKQPNDLQRTIQRTLVSRLNDVSNQPRAIILYVEVSQVTIIIQSYTRLLVRSYYLIS